MGFRSLKVFHFRNLHNGIIPVQSEQVFFIGENGQGKTNFLEALYFLCYGSSFRTRRDEHLLFHGSQEMSVLGIWEEEGLSNEIHITIQNGKKEIKVNGSVIIDRKELVDLIPCIVFSHEDIDFVKGSPDQQRWFFNQTCSMLKQTFLDDLRRYTKILKTRNQILKDNRMDLLPVYDHQLAIHGIAIQRARKETIDLFNTIFQNIFQYISQLPFSLTLLYEPSWKQDPLELEVITLLEDKRDHDLHLKTTTRGPHRDRIKFIYDNKDFTQIGSTGQFRLVSLILRAAQAQLLYQLRKKKPVLLIDDVLLELDDLRRKRFLESLPDFSQAFYTFLPDEHVKEYIQGNRITYQVKDGGFYEERI